MATQRFIYQNYALYASQNGATGVQTGVGAIKQLSRVQSWDDDFSRNFLDVNQFSVLAAIDRIEVEAPSVNASFSYFITDGSNERYAGLTVNKGNGPLISCLSGILTKATDEKNYYVLFSEGGRDAANFAGAKTGVLGIGNAFMTSFSTEASVGSIPTASINLEALNMAIYADADGTNDAPAVYPANGLPVENLPFVLPQAKANDSVGQVSALRPGDINLSLSGNFGDVLDDLKIQSYNLSFDLSRTPQQKLGSRFAVSREPNFPITATLSVSAELGDLSDANLATLLCETGVYNLQIDLKNPSCEGDGSTALLFQLRGAKLSTKSHSLAIGSNGTTDFTYEVSIGAPEDLERGVFISGTWV